jgi:hypothetical protein
MDNAMSAIPDNDAYNESDHCKEVYAYFGLAYYDSGVIESGIVNVLLYAEFISGWKARIEREGKESFDRKIYEAEFDSYIQAQFALTMGQLIARLDKVVGIPAELKEVIAQGKKLRDFLAHHYFRERAKDFVTRPGRDRMLSELSDISQKFTAMDRRIQTLLEPIKQQLGIPEEVMRRFMDEFTRKAYAGEPTETLAGLTAKANGN